jgi:hypothetical protein
MMRAVIGIRVFAHLYLYYERREKNGTIFSETGKKFRA